MCLSPRAEQSRHSHLSGCGPALCWLRTRPTTVCLQLLGSSHSSDTDSGLSLIRGGCKGTFCQESQVMGGLDHR